MPVRRIDPLTVIDDETGQTFYFPDTGQEDSVPSVTRGTPTGDPRYIQPGAPPEVDIGEAVIEPTTQVSVGAAQIEPHADTPVGGLLPMTGQLPPGVGAGTTSPYGPPRSPEEIRAAVESATPRAPFGPPLPAGPAANRGPTGPAPASSVPRGRPLGFNPRTRGDIADAQAHVSGRRTSAAQKAFAVESAAGQLEAEGLGDQADQEAQFAEVQAKEMERAARDAETRWTDWQKRSDEAAASEVNPERFWSSRTSFQRGVWLLSLAAHAWTQDKFGGKNVALGLLQQEIERDIGAQEQNIATKERGLTRESGALTARDSRERGALEDRATAHQLRLRALQRGLEARKAALGPAAAEAKYDEALAAIMEDDVKVGMDLFQNMQQEEERKAQRRMEQQRINIARAAEKRQAAKDKEKKLEPPVTPNLDPRLGLVTLKKDAQGNVVGRVPGGFALDKSHEQAAKVGQAASSGNKEYTALMGLKEALADQSILDKLRSSDAKVRAEGVKLGYARARQLGGPGVLTDQDVDKAMQTVTGQAGLNAWNYLVTPGDPLEIVDEGILTLRDRVTQEIIGTGAVDVSQGELNWEPVLLRPSEPGKRTAADVRTEAAGVIGGETGVAPRRTTPLNLYPGLIRGQIYEEEKKAGTLPVLPPTEAGRQVENLLASVREPSTPLGDIDAAIAQIESSNLDGERRSRAVLELRALRAKAAQRDEMKEALSGDRPGQFGIPVKYERPW